MGRALIHKDSYYQRHKEKIKALVREWQRKHPEKVRKYARQFLQKLREERPEEYKKIDHEDYLKHRDYYIKYATQWQKKNPEKAREYRRQYAKQNKEKIKAQAREWQKEHRNKILKEVSQTEKTKCMRCGYSEFPEILEIHHLDRDRKNNSKINLLVLCASCHSALHRGKWTQNINIAPK